MTQIRLKCQTLSTVLEFMNYNVLYVKKKKKKKDQFTAYFSATKTHHIYQKRISFFCLFSPKKKEKKLHNHHVRGQCGVEGHMEKAVKQSGL